MSTITLEDESCHWFDKAHDPERGRRAAITLTPTLSLWERARVRESGRAES